MLKRLLENRRRAKEQTAGRDQAWSGWDVRDTNGVTPFQIQAESSISEALASFGHKLSSREFVEGLEHYVHAHVDRLKAEFWIYECDLEILTPNGEWSYEHQSWATPEQLIREAVSCIHELCQSEAEAV